MHTSERGQQRKNHRKNALLQRGVEIVGLVERVERVDDQPKRLGKLSHVVDDLL